MEIAFHAVFFKMFIYLSAIAWPVVVGHCLRGADCYVLITHPKPLSYTQYRVCRGILGVHISDPKAHSLYLSLIFVDPALYLKFFKM